MNDIRRFAAGLVLLTSAACSLVPAELRPRFHGSDVPLTVWNRTVAPLFLVDADGRRVEVPACGTASAAAFDLDRVELRHERGYIRTFGLGVSGERAVHHYFVITSRPDLEPFERFNPGPVRPTELPRCEGVPMIQDGT